MDVPDYPSNNQNKPEPDQKEAETAKPKVEKAIEGEAIVRKKSGSSKLAESFSNMIKYVGSDVIVPAAKDMISDAIAQGVDAMLFGSERGSRRKPASRGGNGYVSYNRYSPSSKPQPKPTRTISRSGRATHDFDEIILETRLEAENVVDRMFDLISRYESVTVSDLYELLGIKSKFTDDNWGWTDIRGTVVRRVRSGYLIDLPQPEYFDSRN